MSHSKPFRTVEEALEYFYELSDDSEDECIDICQLPPEESGNLTDEENINEDIFEPILPADVCGEVEIATKRDNTDISNEDLFDPEVPPTSKGRPNLKRKLMSKAEKNPNLYVAAFAVSALASNWERLNKPFNPLLGETYELCRDDLGFRLVCEQVCHHPPISAFHAEAEDFQFYGNVHPKLKFWGKSLEIKPEGTFTVYLKKHKETYSWANVHCCVHNIIIGKLWFEQYGLMEINCHTTGLMAQLNFKSAGWNGRDLHRVEGYIFDGQKKKLRFLYGKWTDYFKAASMEDHDEYMKTHSEGGNKNKHNADGSANDDSNNGTPTKKISSKLNILTRSFTGGGPSRGDKSPEPPVSPHDPEALNDGEGSIPKSDSSASLDIPNSSILWQVQPRPEDSHKYYNFTTFAMSLNELQSDMMNKLPRTDCRFRPDIRKLEEGDNEGAAAEKTRLEEKQRDARKQRKKKKETWNPRWFRLGKVPHIKNEIWLFNNRYNSRDFDDCPDIF